MEKDTKQAQYELDMIERATREVNEENEAERVEANLPYYKLSQSKAYERN